MCFLQCIYFVSFKLAVEFSWVLWEFGFAGAYELFVMCWSLRGLWKVCGSFGRQFSVEFSVESGGAFGSLARVFRSFAWAFLSLASGKLRQGSGLASAFRKFSGSVGISVRVLVQLCWTVLWSSDLVWNVSSSSSSSNWWNILVFVCIFAFVFDLYCIHRFVLLSLCIGFVFDSVFLLVLCWSLNSWFSAKTAISGH